MEQTAQPRTQADAEAVAPAEPATDADAGTPAETVAQPEPAAAAEAEAEAEAEAVAHADAVAAAEAEAEHAAARAGVTVRAAGDVAVLRAVAGLFAEVWAAPEAPPMPHDLMRSLVHAGGAVHAAMRGGQLTGAAVATFGPPASASCYSLITGVRPGAEGRGTGLALKLAQRAWALRAGAASMTWTFDPLLRRNAWFNLVRLGAAVTEYLTDFYGEIPDGVNDPETDRLAVTWDLRAPLPPGTGTILAAGAPAEAAPATGEQPPGTGAGRGRRGAAEGEAASSAAILAAGPAGEPVPGPGRPLPAGEPGAGIMTGVPASTPLRCWIPADIMALRRGDPALARQWRLAVRDRLGGALAAGYQVTGLVRPGWYLLARPPRPPSPVLAPPGGPGESGLPAGAL